MLKVDKDDWPPLAIASLAALSLSTLVAGGTFVLRFQDTWAFYGVVIIATLLHLLYSFHGALELQKNEGELLKGLRHPLFEKVCRVVILTMIQALFALILVLSVPQDAAPSETTGTANPGTDQSFGWTPGAYLMFIGVLYVLWDIFVICDGGPKKTFWRYFWADVCAFLAGVVVLVVVLVWSPSDPNATISAVFAIMLLLGLPMGIAMKRSE